MSCPTCDHTMEKLGDFGGGIVWWCPRCGTATWEDLENGKTQPACVPKLVERCRQFRAEASDRIAGMWKRLGIEESIGKKESKDDY